MMVVQICFFFLVLLCLNEQCRAQQDVLNTIIVDRIVEKNVDRSSLCPNSAPEPNSICVAEQGNALCTWREECCMKGINGAVGSDSCSGNAGNEISEQCAPKFECSCTNGVWLCLFTDFCEYNCDTFNAQQTFNEQQQQQQPKVKESTNDNNINVCPTEQPEPGNTCTMENENEICSWGNECCMKSDNGGCSDLRQVCSPSYECSCYEGYWECLYTEFCYLDDYDLCREDEMERLEMETNCFSSHTTTIVEGKGIVPINDLAVGDRVLIGTGEYQSVYAIDHRHLTKPTTFLQIHYEYYDNNGNNDISLNNTTTASTTSSSLFLLPSPTPLEVTGKHMIFLDGDNRFPVPAESIRVGDKLRTVLSDRTTNPTTVTRINRIVRNGLFNVLTKDGTIVVTDGGVVASTYSAYSLLDSNTNGDHGDVWAAVTIQGHNIISYQTLMSQLSKPYQFVCSNILTATSTYAHPWCQPTNGKEKTTISRIIGNIYEYSYYLRNDNSNDTTSSQSSSSYHSCSIVIIINVLVSLLLGFLFVGTALTANSWSIFAAVLVVTYANRRRRQLSSCSSIK